MQFLFLLFAHQALSITINNANQYATWVPYFSEQFECYEDAQNVYGGGAGTYWCCGIMANGERQCATASSWTNVGGSNTLKTDRFSLCSTNWNTALSQDIDFCCENSEFHDCGVCRGFMVWPWTSFSDMSAASTFETNWRETYTAIPDDDTLAYEKKIYPAGFTHARLREYNDPPVCVYIPNAAGHVIEIRVDPDESGNTVCVNDLADDIESKNNPGQNTACDDSQLRTCFSDGDTSTADKGFAFYVNCEEGCEDGDVNMWIRARVSDMKWATVESQDADTNIEMWCMWMDRDTPEWDTYPSNIRPAGANVGGTVEDGASDLAAFLVVLVLALVMV